MEKQNLVGLYRAIAKLICRLPNIEQKEVVKQLRYYLVKEAKKTFPEYSKSQLSQLTGISRSQLDSYSNKKKPEVFYNKDSIVLSELWNKKDDNNLVPMYGENSFFSIANSILNSSYKPNSTLKTLIETDSVEVTEDGLLIKTYMLYANKNDNMLCEFIGNIFERYTDTAIYNLNNNNVDKMFDQTYTSTKVSPNDAKLAHKIIKSYFQKEVWPHIKEVIDSFESDVDFNTFPIYSVSIFEYLQKSTIQN